MAENLLAINKYPERSPWYPNPYSPYGRRDFIYLKTLQEDHPRVYNSAKNRLWDTLSDLNRDLDPQLNDLYELAVREQKKEDDMLDKVFPKTNASPREDGARIQAFNKLYQHMPIFKRNLENKIKKLVPTTVH